MRDETAGEIVCMLLTLRSDDAGRLVLAEQRPKSTRMNAEVLPSMILIARATNRSVTRWRDGQMCWTAAGMLNAERSFRRIKGHKQMPQLVDALRRHANPHTVTNTESVGAVA
jgi:putative transposase